LSILARHVIHRRGVRSAPGAVDEPDLRSEPEPENHHAPFASIGLGVLADALGIQTGLTVPSSGTASSKRVGAWESYALRFPRTRRSRGHMTDNGPQIDVQSFSWSASHKGARPLGDVANSSRANLLLSVRPSAVTVQLYSDMLEGRTHERVLLCGSRHHAGGRLEEFLRLELGEARVVAHSRGWEPGAGDPLDEIGIVCDTLRYRYHPQNMDGSYGAPVAATWER